MFTRTSFTIVLAFVLGQAILGCASTQTAHVKVSAQDRGVVRNNKEQPEWASSLTKAPDQDKYYVVKFLEGGVRLDVSLQQGKTEALADVAELVGASLLREASSSATGDNTQEGGVDSSSSSTAKVMAKQRVSGARVEDVYWEEVKGKEGEKNKHNVYTLVSIPKAEYARLKSLLLKEQQKESTAKDSDENDAKSSYN